MRQRPDRSKIKMEWIEETIKNQEYTEVVNIDIDIDLFPLSLEGRGLG